jgi:hypothetical protein
MINIKSSVLDDTLIKEIYEKEVMTMSKSEILAHKNNPAITARDEQNNIISVCFIINSNQIKVDEELKNAVGWIYIDDYSWIESYIIPKVKNNGILLVAIESFIDGIGAGTAIVNYLKENYNCIWLYAMADAEEYWQKQEFDDIGDYNYIWIK